MKFIVFCTDREFIVQLVDHQLECRGSMAMSGAVVLNKLSGMCVLVAVSVYSDNRQTLLNKTPLYLDWHIQN